MLSDIPDPGRFWRCKRVSIELNKYIWKKNCIILPFGYFTQLSSMILECVLTSIQLHISKIEVKASIHMVKIRLLQTTFSVLLVSALHIKIVLSVLTLVHNIYSKVEVTVHKRTRFVWIPYVSIWIILFIIFVVHDHREWHNLGLL